MSAGTPEIAKSVPTDGYQTNVHDRGVGSPVLLIHGSGPGVSAWVNWRGVIPVLAQQFRVIAPDMVGFGFTDRPKGFQYEKKTWLSQMLALLDALGLDQVDIVGNSFGGGLALSMAIAHPGRVGRLVLMGSGGLSFPINAELDAVWGYEPSLEAMKRMLGIFAYDRTLVTDELAETRWRASIQPGFHESYSSMFPPPRQRWLDALASSEQDISAIPHETLVIHGREDRVVPPSVSMKLASLIDRSQLHIFGRCGHWTQIEQAHRFNQLVSNFLSEER
jgi:2-hydroxymuconate-semialdehyde hydrolase